ncbi:MAG: bifunctional diguanylate cyclase/phosphodiesterase [Hespellia sp.]|nr:bifunctional diguanylate cyclase/phosphodiesterase [Hespellia sp.]
MGYRAKQQTIIENMNELLCDLVDYYGADYAYYIEKTGEKLPTVYEWCKIGMPFQKEELEHLDSKDYPDWIHHETTGENLSLHLELDEKNTAILAIIGVTLHWDERELAKIMLPHIIQSLGMQRLLIQQEYLSYHDDLTGLLNRNSLVAYLQDTNVKTLKSAGALCVDINGLKLFNREFGREYGDEVVMRVGELLEEFFRGEKVFRLTGDEFLVFTEDLAYEDFLKQVASLQEKLENISLNLATMGYSWEKVDIDLSDMVDRAEEHMRQAKEEFAKQDSKVKHIPVIKSDLLQDLANGNYVVCLQPKIDVDTEEAVAAEALIRYRHPDMGLMDPERYLRLLNRTGLSHYVDMFVFEEVCKILHSWMQRDLPMIPISVNFSGSTLREEHMADTMMELIEQYHIPYEYLEIEISETDEIMNQEMLAETSDKIRKSNIRVILDNFGTKNSSLSILSIMEFDSLKLDKGLITNIVSSRRSQIVAKAIVDVCKELGASVTASGIETQDQFNILKELHCDYAQGFFFNKPIAPEAFEVRYLQD